MKPRKYRTWVVTVKGKPFADQSMYFTPSGTKREAKRMLKYEFDTVDYEVVEVEITELRGGE